ncbi:MAG: hypothetical protein R3E01_00085 [Pirellulaceae bacterium]|nr:hypothetical protein [Planctomycetales bacterium]
MNARHNVTEVRAAVIILFFAIGAAVGIDTRVGLPLLKRLGVDIIGRTTGERMEVWLWSGSLVEVVGGLIDVLVAFFLFRVNVPKG